MSWGPERARPDPEGLEVPAQDSAWCSCPRCPRSPSLLTAAARAPMPHKHHARPKQQKGGQRHPPTNDSRLRVTLSSGKASIVILVVSAQVPKGKSNCSSCLGNCTSHFPREAAHPHPSRRARPRAVYTKPGPITAPPLLLITWQINQFEGPPGSFWPPLQGLAFIITKPASFVMEKCHCVPRKQGLKTAITGRVTEGLGVLPSAEPASPDRSCGFPPQPSKPPAPASRQFTEMGMCPRCVSCVCSRPSIRACCTLRTDLVTHLLPLLP